MELEFVLKLVLSIVVISIPQLVEDLSDYIRSRKEEQEM